MKTNDDHPQSHNRSRRIWSLLLMVLGGVLIAFGLYNPIRDQITFMTYRQAPTLPPQAVAPVESLANNPLPVVETTLVATPTATPSPTAVPTFTPALETMDNTQAQSPTATATSSPSPTPTPNPYPPAATMPARIVAPGINLDSEIVPVGWQEQTIDGQTGSVWEVASQAVGWHQNSALPGHTGNIVLSGHHNVDGEVFRDLVKLNPGDEVTLYADDQPYAYVVEEKFILKDVGEPPEVRAENARWIGPFSDQRLTMISCWPYSGNTHRVVVIARPVVLN